MGSCLALFALAFQLAVSFGHVHVDGGVPGHSSVLLGSHASTALHAVRGGDQSPALADDYCAVCALIHLAGTAIAAAPPSLPLPAVFDRPPSAAAAEFGSTGPDHPPFAARAPPLA